MNDIERIEGVLRSLDSKRPLTPEVARMYNELNTKLRYLKNPSKIRPKTPYGFDHSIF
jgi:hypothetical protein